MNVVYVDKNDKEIGTGSISDALERGIIVRIARVFLFNSNGELLIQKRSDTHKSFPGRWDQTAAGHVDADETYLNAATRELEEEMGIRGALLKEAAKFYTEERDKRKTIRRFNMLFTGVYDGEVRIDTHEVSDFRWVMLSELKKEMKESPQRFAEGFIKTVSVYEKAQEIGNT